MSPPETRPVVLVLDDDDRIRRAMRRMLEPAGYDVIDAENGAQALARAGDGVAIDLLIADLAMPGLQGEEMARRLRATRPGLKVLYVSGDVGRLQDERRSMDEEHEGEAFLSKPFRRQSLLDAVSMLLAGSLAQP